MRNRGFEICKGYEDKNINIPKRSTKHSVAYDLQASEDITIPSIWKVVLKNIKLFLSGDSSYKEILPTKIYTGIKAYFNEDEVLLLTSRSSGPSKLGLILSNSIGIVDSDYYNNESNDGNLIFQYYNIFFKDINIQKGDRIGQAYFQKFLVTDDDKSTGLRKGGIGSTGK